MSFSLFTQTCHSCSELITKNYSTSFSLGILMFAKQVRQPIYSIYGFVRFADEIVDTFHDYNKEYLLNNFRIQTYEAIENKISLNPVLHAFQEVVNEYNISMDLIDAFLDSMAMDLDYNNYHDALYHQYIYGSAEVVGLMCLKVFYKDNEEKYEEQKTFASALGAAFQKVNFLRDMKSDFDERGRVYFPGVDYQNFTAADKESIENDIENDFDMALKGILNLPTSARFGVYVAYVYYRKLFNKIKSVTPIAVKKERIRVNDTHKAYLLLSSAVKNQLNLI